MFFLGVLALFSGDFADFSGDLAAANSPDCSETLSTLENCEMLLFFSFRSLPSRAFESGVLAALLPLIGTGIGMGVCLDGSCVDGSRPPGESERLWPGVGRVAGAAAEAALALELVPELAPTLRWGGRGTGVTFRPACSSAACSRSLTIFCFFADFSALALLVESLVAGVVTGPFSPSCLRFFLELDLGVLITVAS